MQKIFPNKNSSFFSKSSIYRVAFLKQLFSSSCLQVFANKFSYPENQLKMLFAAAKPCEHRQILPATNFSGYIPPFAGYRNLLTVAHEVCKLNLPSRPLDNRSYFNKNKVFIKVRLYGKVTTHGELGLHTPYATVTTFANRTFTNSSLQKSCKSLNNNRITLGHNTLKLKASWHNNLNKYYLGSRNNTMVFKNEFTCIYLIKALQVFASILQLNGNILIINTNPELSKLIFHVKKNIKNTQISFSDCGWTKGTLTNWNKVFNKVKTFIDFHQDYNIFLNENNIHFPNYKKMKKNYKGFSRKLHVKWKPDLLIFTNSNNIESILKEASILKIPTIAFIDSNSNIYDVTYPIPGNSYFYPITRLFFTLISKIANKITHKSSKNYNNK